MAETRYRNDSSGSWRGQRRSNSIFGDEDRDRSRSDSSSGYGERNDDHSFFGRVGEEVRSWFDEGDRDPGRGSYEGSRASGRQSFSGSGSSYDDHYRSWRDRQIAELDRDYEEYRRERQQQFHSDFENWRQSRRNAGSGNMSGETSQGTGSTTTEQDAPGGTVSKGAGNGKATKTSRRSSSS